MTDSVITLLSESDALALVGARRYANKKLREHHDACSTMQGAREMKSGSLGEYLLWEFFLVESLERRKRRKDKKSHGI